MEFDLWHRLGSLFDKLLNFFAIIAGILMVAGMLAINVDVFMRYFLGRPLHNAVFPFIEFSILFITFLGTAWLLKQDGHVRMDFLIARLKPKNRIKLKLVSSAIGIFVSIFFVWYGMKVTNDLWITKEDDLFKLAGFPKAIPIAIIPIGSLLLLVQFVRNAIKEIKAIIKKQEK